MNRIYNLIKTQQEKDCAATISETEVSSAVTKVVLVDAAFESQPLVSLGSFTREGNQQELTGLKFKKSIVVGELGRQTHRQDTSGNTIDRAGNRYFNNLTSQILVDDWHTAGLENSLNFDDTEFIGMKWVRWIQTNGIIIVNYHKQRNQYLSYYQFMRMYRCSKNLY